MSTQPAPFTGGMDRSVAPIRADRGSFYTLTNLRQHRTRRGMLEQTPYFVQTLQTAQGTYYNGGSATEPSSSAVRLISNVYNSSALYVTDYCVHQSASVQLQTYFQTTYPTAETVYTGCMLIINDLTALGITLGSTLDVEMTGAAAFRWRKNGGGWTAGVPSTAGVAIDGGTATLYFLANTGFAGTEAWTWTRTDASCSAFGAGTNRTRPLPAVITTSATYFISPDDRLMAARTAGSTDYVISAGYRPIYANFLTVFSGHLVLLGAASPVNTAYYGSRTRVIKWSDKNDFDNFVATDVNEADTYALPVSTTAQNDALAGVGLGVINNTLFIVTGSEIFWTQDEGLPIVFNFKQLKLQHTFKVTSTAAPVIAAPNGLYILSDSGPYLFDGATAQWVGAALADVFSPDDLGFGVYDLLNDELVCVCNGPKLYVYQTRYGTWYSRGCEFNSTGPTAINIVPTSRDNTLRLGRSNRTVLNEDATWGGLAQAPVRDASNGTAYTAPSLVTQLYNDGLSIKSSVESCYIGHVATGSGTGLYDRGALVQVKLYWDTFNNGNITASPATTATLAVTTSAAADGLVSFPRTDFRAIAFRVDLIPTNSVPVANTVITAFEPNIINTTATR